MAGHKPGHLNFDAGPLNSVQRLDLDQRMVVIAADPEGHRFGRIVERDRAHIDVARHQELDRLAGLRVDPHHAVGAHGRSPQIAVLVELRPVRERIGRQIVFGELLGLGIEHRDFVGAILGDRQAILIVDLEPPHPRMQGRRRIPGHLQGLGVDLAEMAVVEFGHPQIVVGVRNHLIDAVRAAGRQRIGRVEFLPIAGREIDPEDVLRADALGPDFAVDIVAQPGEVELYAIVVVLRGQRIIFDLAGLRVEIAER
jgi:hypothetical protein